MSSTQALADGGTGNVAVALGDGSNAGSRGNHNTAFVLGQGSNAFAYGGNNGNIPQPGNHNTSITVANGGEAGSGGQPQALHRLQQWSAPEQRAGWLNDSASSSAA